MLMHLNSVDNNLISWSAQVQLKGFQCAIKIPVL